jgi:hypothetical protein
MPITKTTYGAARTYTEQQLGGPVTEIETVTAASTAAAKLLSNSPDRVGLVIMNLGSTNVFVSLASNPSANLGILLAPNGGSISLTVKDDFTLCSREWYFSSASATPNVYTLEYVRVLYSGALG